MSLLEKYTQPGESQIPTVSHQGEIPSGQPVCTITIDGKEVTAVVGESILRAAQRAGFNVPTLCDDEKLAPAAACRQCPGYGGELSLEMEVAPTPFPQEVATGKRVAVIGAGPAGLTCAYYAALKGHAVTVFEMEEKQGGMLRYGIPEYRLPKVKLDKELNSVWQLRDAEFKGNMRLGRDFSVEDLLTQGYDAVFLGIGAWSSNELRIPGEDLPGVIEAINYLGQNAKGDPVPVGKGTRVVVMGGGFTTFDCARTSRRIGADVTVGYRRSRKELGAHYSEVDDAEHEGIRLEFFAAPVRIVEKDGRA